MTNTKIEWADATWNPITGCSKISEGCEHCYAERMVKRFPKIYPNGFKPTFHEKRLEEPLHWKKPRRIFVCSMGDLFHEDVSIEWIYKVFDIMSRCPQHTFLLLTKRPERAKALTETMLHLYYPELKYPLTSFLFLNVWLGVTVEHFKHTDRIALLQETNFAHRFVSLEPLLSIIHIGIYLFISHYDGRPIEWVIVGGETGPGARKMKPERVRDIRDDCIKYKVPFFFKKWGGGNKSRLLDGREWNEFPKELKESGE